MKKGIEKENMLKEDDRILIYKFFNKLKSEINSSSQKVNLITYINFTHFQSIAE